MNWPKDWREKTYLERTQEKALKRQAWNRVTNARRYASKTRQDGLQRDSDEKVRVDAQGS